MSCSVYLEALKIWSNWNLSTYALLQAGFLLNSDDMATLEGRRLLSLRVNFCKLTTGHVWRAHSEILYVYFIRICFHKHVQWIINEYLEQSFICNLTSTNAINLFSHDMGYLVKINRKVTEEVWYLAPQNFDLQRFYFNKSPHLPINSRERKWDFTLIRAKHN